MIAIDEKNIEERLEQVKSKTQCTSNFLCLKLGLAVFQKMAFTSACIECADGASAACLNLKQDNAAKMCTCPITTFLAAEFS